MQWLHDFCRLCLIAAAALATPASAGDPFKDPIRAEILTGWERADGSRVVGLRLMLEPGWKTYWRAPGDAGIPPIFDWSKARNVADVAITWPTPEVFDQNGMRSIGYTTEVVIPLTITPQRAGRPVRLRGEMDLGVCDEVCMPHQLRFDVTLDQPGGRPSPAIAAALAATPYSADEAEVKTAVCALRPQSDGAEIEARITLPHTGGTEVVVIEPADKTLWVSEAKVRRRGDTVIAVSDLVPLTGTAVAFDRGAVRITILGSDYAVDILGCAAG